MKISVVIPVYNAERHVRKTLDSVSAQTYSDWECVCVDDGSTDGSGAILDEYAARDSRFRAIHQKNGGEGAARNAGMTAAGGDLIAFLDADDRMHPEALRTFSSLWTKTNFDVLRYAAKSVLDSDEPFEPLDGEPACAKVDFAHCGESPFVFCSLGWSTVITRELSRRLRWTNLKQGADMVFVMDCLLETKSTFRTRAQLVNYYMDPGSISRRISVGLLKGTCDYLPVMLEKADKLGVDPAMRDAGEALARDMLLRRLPGSWKFIDDAAGRQAVESAFWSTLQAMSARPSFCGTLTRAAIALSARAGSLALLRLLVVLPYRAARSMRKFGRACDC